MSYDSSNFSNFDDDQQEKSGPRLPKGRYKARAVSWGLGESSNGNPQVAVCFALLEEDYHGEEINWFGSFSKTLGKGTKTPLQRTIETLRTCGWESEDLSDLAGLDANEVVLVIDHEKDLEGVMRAKVKWVNRTGGLALKTPMTPDKAKAFAAKMRGEVIAASRSIPKSNNGKPRDRVPGEDDEEIGY